MKDKKKEITKNEKSAPVVEKKDGASFFSFKYIFHAIFFIALLLNVYFCSIGINNYLLDLHSFRQSQTALTAFYFVKDGFKIAYDTPIAGAPWSIPFEFPLYQEVVAIVKHILPFFSLDKVGRLVSLMFFYLSLVYVYKITIKYTKNTGYSLFLLSFILLHPIYIFWSRTFMIESTVLFFSVFYVYYALNVLEDNKRYVSLILAIVGGILAGLVKVTTFIPFVFFISMMVLWKWLSDKENRLKAKTLLLYLFYGIVFIGVPIFIAKVWVDYSDKVKMLNKYAYSFTGSKQLNAWNYGTLKQRLSGDTWIQIFTQSQIYNPVLFSFIAIGLLVITVKKYKYRVHAIASLILYFVTPMLFTNLYWVHEYYTYSNSVFMCLCIGFITLSVIDAKLVALKFVGIGLAVAVLLFFLDAYRGNYLQVQLGEPDFIISTTDFIKQHTKPEDVFYMYGSDWGSEFAYYGERRCIALRNNITSVNDTDFKIITEQNKKYNINTLLVVNSYGISKTFIDQLININGYKLTYQHDTYYVFQK